MKGGKCLAGGGRASGYLVSKAAGLLGWKGRKWAETSSGQLPACLKIFAGKAGLTAAIKDILAGEVVTMRPEDVFEDG